MNISFDDNNKQFHTFHEDALSKYSMDNHSMIIFTSQGESKVSLAQNKRYRVRPQKMETDTQGLQKSRNTINLSSMSQVGTRR